MPGLLKMKLMGEGEVTNEERSVYRFDECCCSGPRNAFNKVNSGVPNTEWITAVSLETVLSVPIWATYWRCSTTTKFENGKITSA